MIDFSTLQGLTIPVMTKRVKLTNLVPAMDSLTFSVGSSSGTCEMSTAHTKYNSKVLCSTGVVGYNEMYVLTSQKFQLIPDHFYYACVEVYQETKLGSVDYFWPSGSPSMFGGQATGEAGTWKKCSNITTRTSFTAGEYPVRLDFNNGGTAGKAWFDGLMLIDLTEAFGAGNEPGNAWCQANIPYFTGSYSLDVPLSSPVQAAVTEINDASGMVIWAVSGGKAILEVEKITSDTYAGETTYTGEQFILLDIYPKTNGTVKVTYGGLTKTITDTSGAEEPNAQQVFFGTFNGVSDSVTTPTSGKLTIEGDYHALACGMYSNSKSGKKMYDGLTNIVNFGAITRIPANAFGYGDSSLFGYRCNKIETVRIPNGVVSIGSSAFNMCDGLRNVFIPRSVETIGSNPFRTFLGTDDINTANFITVDDKNETYQIDGNCLVDIASKKIVSGFSDSIIPSYITSIGDWAFCGRGKELLSITLPNSVTAIGERAFDSCLALTSITIPNSVTSIGIQAFNSCSALASITIENGVTSIGERAFEGCDGLESITIPNSVTSIGERAFEGCGGLESITIPNSVTSIGKRAFDSCGGLESITLPNSITSLPAYTFDDCLALASITIPSSVTSISAYLISSSGVKEVILLSTTPPSIASNSFNTNASTSTDTPTYPTIIVPKGCGEAYKAASVWKEYYKDKIVEAS